MEEVGGIQEGSGAGQQHGGLVEEIVFGTRDRDGIDAILDRLCRAQLGAGIADVLFRETSVGVVVAVRLDDERRVVIKAHQPRETQERLAAVLAVQSRLHQAGFPCPKPLLGPVALANGQATLETLVTDGEFRDTHDPACRRLIADALAWHLQITHRLAPPAALGGGWSLFDGDRLWPAHAHSPIFNFDATGAGAQWIDALGAQAKTQIARPGPSLVGHSDWSGKHFRFTDQRITAVYDWDSLSLRSEAALVGTAAITYTTRFDLPGVPRAPSPQEMSAFITEYSNARARVLTRRERGQIAAHALLLAAYTARCEHCGLNGYDADADPASFTTALRAHGDAYLLA